MKKRYDATAKDLLETDPAGWLAFLGLPATGPVRLVDSDLSTVSAAADKVIRVDGPSPYLLHVEFQAGRDRSLARRLLRYHVLLDARHRVPVHSTLILLRKEADHASLDGHLILTRDGTEPYLTFRYQVVRIWEQSADAFANGPLAMLPLAPIADVPLDGLPELLRRIGARLDAESEPEEVRRLLLSTSILLGLRLDESHLVRLIQEVFDVSRIYGLEHSSFIQFYIKKGVAQGKSDAIEVARSSFLDLGTSRFGPPDPETRETIDRIDDLSAFLSATFRLSTATSWADVLLKLGEHD